jgi:hypothetical protein
VGGHQSTVKQSIPETGSPVAIVQGLEGRESQFTSSKERALSGQVLDYESEHGGLNDKSAVTSKNRTPYSDKQAVYENGEDTQKYDAGDCGVSLHSVMQSQVPDPFNPHGRNPTHLNMPGGGRSQQQKYLSGNLQKSHPSRHFSTDAGASSLESAVEETGGSPQGIQGDHGVDFELWLENCQRFNLSCEDQVQGIQGGRKTLLEIFVEQELLVQKISEDYNNAKDNRQGAQDEETGKSGSYIGTMGSMQGLQDSDWLAGHTVESLSQLRNPCPQGIQGENCERFKLWLDNCTKFHVINCDDQLQEVQTGRKTLAEIFEEQERIIEEIAHHYSTKQEASASS